MALPPVLRFLITGAKTYMSHMCAYWPNIIQVTEVFRDCQSWTQMPAKTDGSWSEDFPVFSPGRSTQEGIRMCLRYSY